MSKFNLSAKVTISIYTEVEAETLEEAIKIAEEREIEKYEWGDEDQVLRCWINDEYDGEPFEITED